jgi:hypothetical protein
MKESNDRESSKKENSESNAKEADSAATSKETLNDIEESEADVSSWSSQPDPGPSPDGTFDEGGEIKDAGPM